MEDRDAAELVLVLKGYYRLLTGQNLQVQQEQDPWNSDLGNYFMLIICKHYIGTSVLVLIYGAGRFQRHLTMLSIP